MDAKQVSRKEKRAEIKAREQAQWAMLLIPVAFALGVFVGYLYWGRLPAQTTTTTVPGAADNAQAVRQNVSVDDDPAIGPADAPVTVVEFSDYQCPYCKLWHDQVFSQLIQAYQGKVRFVYRDFPLYGSHPDADPAAQAADCANEQGKYWEFQELLFDSGVGSQAYLQYAAQLGLDADKFQQCISSQKYAAEVKADSDYAATLGVHSTPTFFINGVQVIGAQSFEVFQQMIDQVLAKNQ